jgi:hypothetical protein
MADIPKWHVQGDWFDTCKCSIPCPCTFAQPPTSGDCEGILAWNIRQGNYGGVRLDGLSVIGLGSFTGNLWEGKTKASMAMFIDERADERQREALQMIFGGRVGGWPGTFASFIGEVRWADRRPHPASECRCTTPVAAKQVQAASRPMGRPPQTRLTPSASNGIARGSRAST